MTYEENIIRSYVVNLDDLTQSRLVENITLDGIS